MSELYGASGDDNNKKINRITVSIDNDTNDFISAIADELGISNSEVINRLIAPTIKKIKKQKELIEQKPLAVAFDWITKGNE